MTNTIAKCLTVIFLGLGFSACTSMSTTEKRTMTGAGIGAASGALIGELATGQPLAGAAIGTAVGAAGGWLYDRHEKNE